MQSSAVMEKQKVLDNKVAVIKSSVQVIHDHCIHHHRDLAYIRCNNLIIFNDHVSTYLFDIFLQCIELKKIFCNK